MKTPKSRPVFSYSQTCSGDFFFRDKEGDEVHYNVNEMGLDDIRSLLVAIANLQLSLSATLWDKQLTEKKGV